MLFWSYNNHTFKINNAICSTFVCKTCFISSRSYYYPFLKMYWNANVILDILDPCKNKTWRNSTWGKHIILTPISSYSHHLRCAFDIHCYAVVSGLFSWQVAVLKAFLSWTIIVHLLRKFKGKLLWRPSCRHVWRWVIVPPDVLVTKLAKHERMLRFSRGLKSRTHLGYRAVKHTRQQ